MLSDCYFVLWYRHPQAHQARVEGRRTDTCFDCHYRRRRFNSDSAAM